MKTTTTLEINNYKINSPYLKWTAIAIMIIAAVVIILVVVGAAMGLVFAPAIGVLLFVVGLVEANTIYCLAGLAGIALGLGIRWRINVTK